MTVEAQVHGLFKLFAGKLNEAGHIGVLGDEVAAWVAAKNVAPKSLGVVYLPKTKDLILSIGYREEIDETPYAIKLASTKITKVLPLDAGELVRLERGLTGATGNQKNVISHAVYLNDAGEMYMVTMSHVQTS